MTSNFDETVHCLTDSKETLNLISYREAVVTGVSERDMCMQFDVSSRALYRFKREHNLIYRTKESLVSRLNDLLYPQTGREGD